MDGGTGLIFIFETREIREETFEEYFPGNLVIFFVQLAVYALGFFKVFLYQLPKLISHFSTLTDFHIHT